MKKIAFLLLVLPSLALAQGLSNNLPWAQGGKTLASFGLSSNGPVIDEDANVVSHVVFNPAVKNWALQSNSMTTGTGVTAPWTHSGITMATVAGAPSSVGGGTWAEITSTTTFYSITQTVTTGSSTTATGSMWLSSVVPSELRVQVGCNNGTAAVATCTCARSDGGACTAAIAATNYCRATATDIGSTPVRMSASASCAAATTSFAFQLTGPLSGVTTRVTGAQLETGVIKPSALLVTTTAPATVRPVNTNYALQSNTLSTGTAATSPWALASATVTTVPGAPAYAGGGNWAEVTTTVNTGEASQSVTVPSTTTLVASGWMSKSSGSGTSELGIRCIASGTNAASSCSCGRDDGLPCTASPGSPNNNWCKGSFPSVGSTPVRGWLAAVCSGATTSATVSFRPGEYNVSTGTARFTGAQLEVGTTASDIITTAGTAVAMDRALVELANNQVDTNYLTYSNALSSGTLAGINWALTAGATVATVAGAPASVGGGTWAEVTNTSNQGALYADLTGVSLNPITASVWTAAPSGTGTAAVRAYCGPGNNVTACSCQRSDGGTCTSEFASVTTVCKATATGIGTTPVRLTATAVCTSAATAPGVRLVPSDYGVSTGTMRFAGAMLEGGSRTGPSDLVVTTSAAASATRPRTTVPVNRWAMAGTVPQVQTTPGPFYNADGLSKAGAGPFSAANYYSLGTGTDVLDFAGDFTVCAVFNTVATGSDQALVSAYASGASGEGWFLGLATTTGVANLYTYAPSANTASVTTNAAVAGSNVVCAGRSGSTQYIKMNLGTTDSDAGSKTVAGSATVPRIGLGPSTAFPNAGTIYEVYATTSPWNEATVTAIQQKVLGHYASGQYSPLAVTRATNATYIPRQGDCASGLCLYTAAPGVARFTESGMLVEPARTNYALQSNTMSTGTAATSPWALSNATVATVAGAPMGGTWAEVTSTTNAGYMLQNLVHASSASIVGSVWMVKASGAGAATVGVRCSDASAGNVPTACSCVRSDGGTCTSSLSGYYCYGLVTTLATTPVRLSVGNTCTSAATATNLVVYPGENGVATGTTRFSGAQLEVGTYPTSLIVSTSTSVARNSDQISATVPAVPAKWCIAVTAQPEERRAWASSSLPHTWSLGSVPSAMATWEYNDATNFVVGTRDATNAANNFTSTATVASLLPTSVAARMVTCGGSTGRIQLSLNGTPVAGAQTGVGTGISGIGITTLTFSRPSFEFGGYLKNLKICKASKPGECK